MNKYYDELESNEINNEQCMNVAGGRRAGPEMAQIALLAINGALGVIQNQHEIDNIRPPKF